MPAASRWATGAWRSRGSAAPPARRAGGAADPRERHAPVAHRDAAGIGADCHHRAGDLVAEHARRRDAAAQVELLAIAEIEVALVQMHVAVAQAAAADTQDDLA